MQAGETHSLPDAYTGYHREQRIFMTNAIKFLAVAAFSFSGTAIAEPPAGNHGPDKADMQRHAAEMCQDRKAHAVGEVAYLEAKLALSDKQKPLFERWKKIKLASANAAGCAPPPDSESSIIEALKGEEKFLHAQLETLKAELPALEALYGALDETQKKAFAPPHGGPMGPGFDALQGRGPGGHGHDRPGSDAFGPPPPEH
jgi:hypothetical protein